MERKSIRISAWMISGLLMRMTITGDGFLGHGFETIVICTVLTLG